MKVQPREFKEGNMVLRKIILLLKKDHSKRTPNYRGLFIIK
jgi:hypothetical protein